MTHTHGKQSFARKCVEGLANGIFRWRLPLLVVGVVITVILAASATRLQVQAGFAKMVPLAHPYMQTFLKYQQDFGGANKVVVTLKAKQGDVFNAKYLDELKRLHDDLFFVRGVERSSLISLYSPATIFMEVVEDGFRAGQVLPSNFDGSAASIEAFRGNLMKSQWLGSIVANDFSAALVSATLLDKDPESGEPLDLKRIGADLEKIRAAHENDQYSVHILGFAKSSSDIAAGASEVIGFFAIATLITAVLLYWYTASLGITVTALCVAAAPVVWLLGLMPLAGLTLDPVSILAPFLIFSIGVSHAVQMTNAWSLETLRGMEAQTAARNSFLKLFIPGASALLANAIGFMVIAFVDIGVVRELVMTATLGVTLMIASNKVLLPILLSYMKVNPKAKKAGHEKLGGALWTRLAIIATPARAWPILLVGVLLLAAGLWKARDQVIGDLGEGVPELRAESRYNRDVKVITSSFSLGVDVLQVIAQGKNPSDCNRYEILDSVDRLDFELRQSPDVQSVSSLASFVKEATVGFSEGDAKWATIPVTKEQRNQATGFSTRSGASNFINRDCSAMNISIYPLDHQSATLARIVARIKDFKQQFDSEGMSFLLAMGNAGVMAATNEAVTAADHWVNYALFGAVALLCLITFHSLAVTACIVIPLGIVTVLCYALMAQLGIGMKVNTLPVVALGVGVGVDYGIYLFEVIRHEMNNRGHTLQQAFLSALQQRGTASLFTAVTMSVGVGTWFFSSLKMQADMGVLLVFMFMVNAFGALLLSPALASFLLRKK